MLNQDDIPSGPLSQFDDNSAIIFGLDSSFRLVYSNSAWDRFALENGGAHLLGVKIMGCNVVDVVPGPLKRFYSELYGGVLHSGVSADQLYECCSDTIFRRFHMHVERKKLPNQPPWLIVMNSLILEQPHQSPEVQTDKEELRGENGLITMCCHCRRTKMPNAGHDLWLWIPELVRKMPLEVSHGICSVCFYVYYEK